MRDNNRRGILEFVDDLLHAHLFFVRVDACRAETLGAAADRDDERLIRIRIQLIRFGNRTHFGFQTALLRDGIEHLNVRALSRRGHQNRLFRNRGFQSVNFASLLRSFLCRGFGFLLLSRLRGRRRRRLRAG